MFTLSNTNSAPVALTVGGNNGDTTYPGASSSASLTKMGQGTLTLTGSNTVSGTGSVTVGAGAITVASTGSLTITPTSGNLYVGYRSPEPRPLQTPPWSMSAANWT